METGQSFVLSGVLQVASGHTGLAVVCWKFKKWNRNLGHFAFLPSTSVSWKLKCARHCSGHWGVGTVVTIAPLLLVASHRSLGYSWRMGRYCSLGPVPLLGNNSKLAFSSACPLRWDAHLACRDYLQYSAGPWRCLPCACRRSLSLCSREGFFFLLLLVWGFVFSGLVVCKCGWVVYVVLQGRPSLADGVTLFLSVWPMKAGVQLCWLCPFYFCSINGLLLGYFTVIWWLSLLIEIAVGLVNLKKSCFEKCIIWFKN